MENDEPKAEKPQIESPSKRMRELKVLRRLYEVKISNQKLLIDKTKRGKISWKDKTSLVYGLARMELNLLEGRLKDIENELPQERHRSHERILGESRQSINKNKRIK